MIDNGRDMRRSIDVCLRRRLFNISIQNDLLQQEAQKCRRRIANGNKSLTSGLSFSILINSTKVLTIRFVSIFNCRRLQSCKGSREIVKIMRKHSNFLNYVKRSRAANTETVDDILFNIVE